MMEEGLCPVNFDELWLVFNINEAKKIIRARRETVNVRILAERHN